MAVRHVGEQETPYGKNQLHEVLLGGSELTFIISNFKVYVNMCLYAFICVYIHVCVCNVLSNSVFSRSQSMEVWEVWELETGVEIWEWIKEILRAYPVCACVVKCKLLKRLSNISTV